MGECSHDGLASRRLTLREDVPKFEAESVELHRVGMPHDILFESGLDLLLRQRNSARCLDSFSTRGPS